MILECEVSSSSLRVLVYLVIYDPGQVSLEHLLLSWYPWESVVPTNPESIPLCHRLTSRYLLLLLLLLYSRYRS